MKRLICLLFVLVGATASADEPLLEPNDRLALLGGTFVERLQSSGALEAQLQTRRPDWMLRVRNLGWSGDDVHGAAPPKTFRAVPCTSETHVGAKAYLHPVSTPRR